MLSQRMRFASWPLRQCAVISDTNSLSLMARQLLRSMNWDIIVTDAQPAVVIAGIERGDVSFVIVDDTDLTPAPLMVRHLQTSAIAAAIPTYVFLRDTTRMEEDAVAALAFADVTYKPFTPNGFYTGLDRLIDRWSAPNFEKLREALRLMGQKALEPALKILVGLSGESDVQSLVAAPLAHHYLHVRHDPRTAEKILLAAMKAKPKCLSVILALVDLYLRTAAPQFALRLCKSAHNLYPGSIIPMLDWVQCGVMLDDMTEAVSAAESIVRTKLLGETALDVLSRLLVAEGHDADIELWAGQVRRRRVEQIVAAFSASESQPAATRKVG